jgi:DNA-binding NarL/FixJ family response regulator
MTIRLVLVDDHAILRQALRHVLDEESDLQVVGEAENGWEAISQVREHAPDVVVMDLTMPELDGLAATEKLRDEFPAVRVLILSGMDEEVGVVSAVRAGAIGYVRKTSTIDSLLHAIRSAAQGQVQFSSAAAARLVHELHAPTTEPEHLTGRELEVVGLVARGLANKEIAWRLRISEKTVKSHVSTILSKFGLDSRTQAALHATRLGLVPPEPLESVAVQPVRVRPVVSIDHQAPLQLRRTA